MIHSNACRREPWLASMLAFGLLLVASEGIQAQSPALLEGNMIGNPGFEDDWHHNGAEGHVLAFMGDWSFGAADLKPDYWSPTGTWSYAEDVAHTGTRSLLLKGKAGVTRGVVRAGTKGAPGGGDRRWGNPGVQSMTYEPAVKLASTVRAAVWFRSSNLGGANRLVLTVTSSNVDKSAATDQNPPGGQWARLEVELTRQEIEKAFAEGKAKGVQLNQAVSVATEGDAEVYIDDVSLADERAEPNLAAGASFESVDASGYPAEWSQPMKYRFYTQQYYKWTSWNHFFSQIRGSVTTTDLVARTGRRSLLMQLYPGDEMLVEGSLVTLNQQQPGIVEVGAYVLLDRVKWIDLRAIDQDGNELACADAFTGGWPVPQDSAQLYPSNAADWIYVRKCFLSDKPLKGIRPRLCARGFNGDTRDDGGTRPNVNQVGLAWWDDVRVVEITATPQELQARGVKPPAGAPPKPDAVLISHLDLGDRLYGDNIATVTLSNPTGQAAQVELALAVVEKKDASTPRPAGVKAQVPAGGIASVKLPYRLDTNQMQGRWDEQGYLRLDLASAGKTRSATLAYNTWPVIVDVDLYRHYATPDENPQAVALNFGVARATLAGTKSVVLETRRRSDDKVVDSVTVPDLAAAVKNSRANFAELSKQQFENPTPVQFADRKNLVALMLDLGKLPVHPFDNPQRDHYLAIRGLDAGGKETFTDSSQSFGRVQPNQEKLPAITKTAVREDGAVLINGQPAFLMAGNMYTTGHYALNPAANKKMGFNAIRWVENIGAVEANWQANLYSLETMVSKGAVNPQALEKMEATLKQWKQEGKLAGVVTISPYYEHSSASMTPEQVALEKRYTGIANSAADRISNFGGGGAHNIYTLEQAFDAYDSFGLEIEPFGPPRGEHELAPVLRMKGKAWFHLPQSYNTTPYDFFRFDQYSVIVQGGRGFSTIHGLGDPSFMRGVTGEIRYLSPAIFSLDHGDRRTAVSPDIRWMQRKVGPKTTLIAVSKPAVEIGRWTWRDDADAPDGRAHTGVSEFEPRPAPDGLRLHGFRESKPVLIEKGDRIVQWVELDPGQPPGALAWGVRGDAKWDFNAHYGQPFNFQKWRNEFVNFWLGGELLPGTWQIGWQYNDATKNWFADHILAPASFKLDGQMPTVGQWTKLEMEADKIGLVGKEIDGFFFLAQNGNASWARSAIVRGEKEIVLCGTSIGPSRDDLAAVRFDVPWAPDGTKVKVLFEQRELTVKDGHFTDDFRGEDFFLTVRGGATGDAVGWHPIGTELKGQTLGYVTPRAAADVHVYEIPAGP